MKKDWRNIAYLAKGNPKQRICYMILHKYKILERLEGYDPIIIGTIPIEIDIEGSDVDIACQPDNLLFFSLFVRKQFSHYSYFIERIMEDSYVAAFTLENIDFEIYGERTPVEKQNGYRHMIVEKRILDIAGKNFRNEIIKLKKKGYKTEPAFGKLLNMENPYTELLSLEKMSDGELKDIIPTFIK